MPENKNTSDFFESYACDFDAIYGGRRGFWSRIIDRLFRRSMRLRYEKTIRGCQPTEGKTVLDIGCGPGHYGIALARSGAERVTGIDFAPAMIDLARDRAANAGVSDRCKFIVGDFFKYDFDRQVDYAIVMGFMDYAADQRATIKKVLSLTKSRAFFSFPAAEGFLAWQRRCRYRTKCDLYLYHRRDVEKLFESISPGKLNLEKLGRDYFVTIEMG